MPDVEKLLGKQVLCGTGFLCAMRVAERIGYGGRIWLGVWSSGFCVCAGGVGLVRLGKYRFGCCPGSGDGRR